MHLTPSRTRSLLASLAATLAVGVAAAPADAMKWKPGTVNADVVDCRSGYCLRNGVVDWVATCNAYPTRHYICSILRPR